MMRTRRLLRVAVGVFVAICFAVQQFPATVAAPPVNAVKPIAVDRPARDSTPPDIRRWIDNLSHPSADLRQIATRKLVQAGRPALPALIVGVSHRNPETAARSRLILLRMCLAKDVETSHAAVDAVLQLADTKSASIRRWSGDLLQRLRLTAEVRLKEGGVAVTPYIDKDGHDVARVDMSRWKGRDQSLVTLRFLGRIGSIDLSKSRIDNDGLQWLREHRFLQILELRSTEIGDEGLKSLAGLTELTELDLRETKVTGTGLKSLQKLTKLQSLHLGDTQLADGGLRHLPNAAGLKYLNLSTAKLTDADLMPLKRCRSLEELWISHTDIGDVGLQHLSGLPNLQVLGLSGSNVTDAGLKSLYALKSLKKLWMTRTAVTSRGAEALRKRLPGIEIRR